MIPPDTDIADLSRQLNEDSVAYSNVGLASDPALQASVAGALEPGEGIAVVDIYPDKFADLRDLAQALKEASNLDTVIVQAPQGISAVSDSHSRAALESAQQAVAPGLDQVTALNQLHTHLGTATMPAEWLILGLIIIALAGAVAAFTRAHSSKKV